MPPRLPTPRRQGAALGALLAVSLLVSSVGSPRPAWADAPGWRFPAAGLPQVLRAFAPPRYDWLPGHRGVDLALVAGQAVRAPADGTVTFAAPVAGQGVITLSHGDLRSTYEPVEPAVEVGDKVAAGDLLGWLEPPTGHCGRTCLHWGVLRGETYLDPLSLVDLGPPILLPVGLPVAAPQGLDPPPALIWASGQQPPDLTWAGFG